MSDTFRDLISPADPLTLSFFQTSLTQKGGGAFSVDRTFETFEDLADWMSEAPVKRRAKKRVPLFTRGRCEGKRLKENLQPPFLVILDMDKVEMPIQKASAILRLYDVDHCGYTTHSHGNEAHVTKKGEDLYSYRIFTDHVARTWGEVRDIVEQLFEILGLDTTHESYNSPGWFAPAFHPDREDRYCYIEHLTGGSLWEPTRHADVIEKWDRPPDPVQPIEDMDVAEVQEALAYIPNEEREDWIEIGMALHATGHEDAYSLWDEWSSGQEYSDYDPDENERIWESFRERQGGVSLGTIYFRARENDWDPTPSVADDFSGWERDDTGQAVEAPWSLEEIGNRKAALRKMNERFAFVAEGNGKIADTMPTDDRPIRMLTLSAFDSYYATPTYPHPFKKNKDGDPIQEPISKLWRNWKGMRRYMKRDFMPPGGPPLGPEILNVWRGWGVTPDPTGSCQLYLDHIRDNICSGNDEWYRWTVAWMAQLFQRPWEKPGTALVLRSGEGTGKGIFAGALKHLCGSHGLQVTDPRHLTGNFNQHLFGSLLVFADEVTWGGRKQEEGVLKALVSEGDAMVEAKGVDAERAHQFFRVVVSSNLDWVVPAGPTARRWQVFDVGERHMQDRDYFAAVLRQLRRGGYEALLHHLLTLDLADYPDPSRIVATAALAAQKVVSFDLVNTWIYQILSDGNLGNSNDWPEDWIAKRTLYDSYLETAAEVGENRRSIATLVGGRLKKVFGSQLRTRRSRVGADSERVWQVKIPPLDVARKLFEANVIQADHSWEDEDDER